MNDVDKIMALHDDCIAARENPQCSYQFEQQKREAIRAAIVEALDLGEPVEWQFIWTNPGNMPDQTPKWEPVKPNYAQTMREAILELESYRYDGKPCYTVRALYAAKEQP